LKQKIKIAISACLTGQKVRYDGKEKTQPLIMDFLLSEPIDFVPFCPEVGIGLGVPRDKIQLVKQKDQQIRVLGVEDHTWDVTDALKLYARDFLIQNPDIKLFIVKSKSPSCAYQSTPLLSAEQSYEQVALVSGQFIQTIMELAPQMPIIDEIYLNKMLLSGAADLSPLPLGESQGEGLLEFLTR